MVKNLMEQSLLTVKSSKKKKKAYGYIKKSEVNILIKEVKSQNLCHLYVWNLHDFTHLTKACYLW